MKRKERKSGFGDFTVNQLRNLEQGYFFVLLGGDFVVSDGIYSLTKREAKVQYDDILEDLIGISREGLTAKDRKHALDLISSVCIIPARIH